MSEKYLIAGGDMRFIRLAEYMSERNCRVFITGFDKASAPEGKVHTLSVPFPPDEKMDHIILPLPVSNDGIYVNMPCSDDRVPIEAYADCLKPDGIIFGGRFPDKAKQILEDRGITVIDYSTREEFAVLNAIATAEGALQTIMEETPTVVSGQKILIIGMGRISKALIQILRGFNCDITVAARKCSALAWAEVYGCKHIHTNELGENLGDYSVIINTVPAVLLDRERLRHIRNDCLVIDLASKPGGVDFDTANALGKKVIWLLSLPGKAAPQSAGETIGKTISNILTERSAGG